MPPPRSVALARTIDVRIEPQVDLDNDGDVNSAIINKNLCRSGSLCYIVQDK